MRLKNLLTLFLFFLLITSCSLVNSDSDSDGNTIRGKVIEDDNVPVENVDIGVVYRFSSSVEDTSSKTSNEVLWIFPTPFVTSASMFFMINSDGKYWVKAINLENEQEVTLYEETVAKGNYTIQIQDVKLPTTGIYQVYDSKNRKQYMLYAPVIPVSGSEHTLKVEGKRVGEFLTKTNEDGTFTLNTDNFLSVHQPFRYTNSSGEDLGTLQLRDDLYIVAYRNENLYKTRLVNPEEIESEIIFKF